MARVARHLLKVSEETALLLGELKSAPVAKPLQAEVRVGLPLVVAHRRVGVRAQVEIAARNAGAAEPRPPAAGVEP